MKFQKMVAVVISFQVLFFMSATLSVAGTDVPGEVSVWTYYDFPPFILDKEHEKGLTYDFVSLLNKHAGDKYRFKAVLYPRKRIDNMLEQGKPGIVAWVNPLWFGDREKKQYLWTKDLLHDQHEVISRTDKPIDFRGPESLKGLRLGGIKGHKYIGIDDAIEKGDISRYDARNERHNIRNLLADRIDITLMPKTAVLYLMKEMKLAGKLYLSPTPLNTYTRHLLIQKQLKNAEPFLSEFISALPQNEEWKSLLSEYGLGM